MSDEIFKTGDKQAALDFLARHLESKERINVGIEYLGGVYTIEVSRPTNECADELP